MNRDKMSEFIADYLQNDKTTFAMMLSGEWGTGKSFYIKGELSKEIKNNGNELMVISLYGMSNLQELSQRICYERFHTSINAVKAIKATAKTIINYSPLPSIIWKGVEKAADIIKDQIDNSIDLTGILLVLEDVERTKIDLEDFFGYVNNLCEQDNVKVLLVADENKIREKFKEKKKSFDDIKDKVVGDTIHFEPDLEATLRNIFDIYGFNDVCDLDADMSDIRKIITDRPNFRKVIYACKKVHDIFDPKKNPTSIDDKYFHKCIFLSTLSYIHDRKDSQYKWKDGEVYKIIDDKKTEKVKQFRMYLSPEMGTEKFPLPKFVYEYISNQNLDENLIKKCNDDYDLQLKMEASSDDIPNFKIITAYLSQEGEVLKSALNEVADFISDESKKINLKTLAELLPTLSIIICDIATESKFEDLKDAAEKLENGIVTRFKKEEIATRRKIFSLAQSFEALIGTSLEHYKEKYKEITELVYEPYEENRYIRYKGDINQFFKHTDLFDYEIRTFNECFDVNNFVEVITKAKNETIVNINYNLKILLNKSNISEEEKWKKVANKLKKSLDQINDPIVCYNIKNLIDKINEKIK